MTKTEYNRVCRAIVTNNPLLRYGSRNYHYYGNHFYAFTVIEPGTYRFNLKIAITAENESIINAARSRFYGER